MDLQPIVDECPRWANLKQLMGVRMTRPGGQDMTKISQDKAKIRERWGQHGAKKAQDKAKMRLKSIVPF